MSDNGGDFCSSEASTIGDDDRLPEPEICSASVSDTFESAFTTGLALFTFSPPMFMTRTGRLTTGFPSCSPRTGYFVSVDWTPPSSWTVSGMFEYSLTRTPSFDDDGGVVLPIGVTGGSVEEE